MGFNGFLVLLIFCLFASLGSSQFISNAAFESYKSTGRSLLQAQKNCPTNFENQNYTIITSQCKGPKYSADVCCKAFKEFACPFVDQINDLTTNCATTMFSYINLYGKYPPGLFANECKEGKKGLDCTNITSANVVSKNSENAAQSAYVLSPVMVLLGSILVFLICLF